MNRNPLKPREQRDIKRLEKASRGEMESNYCATRESKMAKDLEKRGSLTDLLTAQEHLKVARLHIGRSEIHDEDASNVLKRYPKKGTHRRSKSSGDSSTPGRLKNNTPKGMFKRHNSMG